MSVNGMLAIFDTEMLAIFDTVKQASIRSAGILDGVNLGAGVVEISLGNNASGVLEVN